MNILEYLNCNDLTVGNVLAGQKLSSIIHKPGNYEYLELCLKNMSTKGTNSYQPMMGALWYLYADKDYGPRPLATKPLCEVVHIDSLYVFDESFYQYKNIAFKYPINKEDAAKIKIALDYVISQKELL